MSDFDTVFKQFKDNTKPMCELMREIWRSFYEI